ncbi:WG repeat-containing protein [Achromobacter arsenitoxydans]|uniref:KWG Leptospira family protein 2 n=1 Tax=Achromobacter arsenitoxydans SY8 TaxID=477184 RepID=H0F0P4_9BURK|nr:WG repeat-containing protein [Achromobacter arsenitoxydans]EHK68151.1 KWG Leptospira family protein 2 [Achromobacter arsenitoxydans SY8]
MTSRALRTTRLACALAALGVSLSAQAQSGHLYCLAEGDYLAYPAADDIASRNPFGNGCIRDLSDGRAAVLLPSAIENIDRVPRNSSLRRHAWGFLDANGRVAIEPIFEAVRDFRHGLAAVQWQGKWGYIDTNGRMAVRPRYDAVEDFVEIGLAVATLDGRPVLIDRQGNPAGAPLEENVRALRLSDGVPARATVQYKEEYRSSDGERRYGGTGVVITKPFGNGLYVATNGEGKYGVVDKDWKWIIEPELDDVFVQNEGALATAYGREGSVMVTAEGKLIGQDQHYESMNPVGKAFWSAALPRRAGYAVLDASGAVVATLTQDEGQASQRHADIVVYPSGGNIVALVPGRPAPVTLGTGIAAADEAEGYVLFVDGASQPAGLLTPTGAWLHGDSAPAWLGQVGRMEARLGKLWVSDAQGRLLNVLDTDGRALLKPEAVQAAQDLQLKPLSASVPGGPLGLLGQGHCHCGGAESGAGLLLADGSIVSDPSWNELIPLDLAEDAPADGLAADQLRYAAETDDGMLLLDARGKPVDLPAQQHIGVFRHGYAQVYGDGVVRMIDRTGKTYELPEAFDTQVVAPGVVRFLKTAADGEPWGLYDFVAGKALAAPAFRSIGEFQDGQAVASLGPDRVGVIDQQGRWILPASHHDAERVNDKLWRVSQAGGKHDRYDRPAAVFNTQGQALTGFLRGLQVGDYGDGSISAGNDRNRWIISPDGTDALDMKDADYVRLGDWMEIRRADRHGYLNSQGSWQIEPAPGAGSDFHGAPARALASNADGTRVIDANGKTLASLPSGDWSWPRGSATLIRHYTAKGKTMTDYADPTGKTRLTVEGFASAYSEGRAVAQVSSDGVRAVDAKGALVGPAYDAMGAMRDGLAPASADHAYGYVDSTGSFAILAAYRVASAFSNQRAVVSTEDDSRIIDTSGKTLARVQMQCGIRTLYGAAGQRLWPLRMPQGCKGRPESRAY